MISITDKRSCCGCSACTSACPVGCIVMTCDSEGFLYPAVDEDTCVGCQRCESVCPFLNGEGVAPVTVTYAARSLDPELLHESSSGGVFTELCKPVLSAGGVVYGVAMDANCRGCSFMRVESIDGMAPLRGSKYMQADSRGVYELVDKDIKSGRKVLFSGTPCQVNALSRYLGDRRYDVLLVDCICHGVPSPRLWAESIADLEARKCASVNSVNFRCKEASWHRPGLRAELGDTALFQPLDESPYLRMFLKDVSLRESCYSCVAKDTRSSDITMADFWGVESVVPEMSDELGCSLVIARTPGGAEALREVRNAIEMKEVDYATAVLSNPSVSKSARRPPERDVFFQELEKIGYEGVARKYGTASTTEKAKRFVKKALSKMGLLQVVRKLRAQGSSINGLRYGILYLFDDAKATKRSC